MTEPNPHNQEDPTQVTTVDDAPDTPTITPPTQDLEVPNFLQNLQHNLARRIPTFAPATTTDPIDSLTEPALTETDIAQQLTFADEPTPENTVADTDSTEATGNQADPADRVAQPQATSSDDSTYANAVIDNRLLSLMIDTDFIADLRQRLGLSTIVLEQEHHTSFFC